MRNTTWQVHLVAALPRQVRVAVFRRKSFPGNRLYADMTADKEEILSACPPGLSEFGPGQITNQCDLFHFWSPHIGGAHFLFVDGSTRFLSYSAVSVMPALATRAGGETVQLP